MENKNKEKVLNHFKRLQLNKEPKKRQNWGIFVNGERVRLSNGKVVWSAKNHASSAMRNEFQRWLTPRHYEFTNGMKYGSSEFEKGYSEYRQAIKNMEDIYTNMKEEGVIQFLPV